MVAAQWGVSYFISRALGAVVESLKARDQLALIISRLLLSKLSPANLVEGFGVCHSFCSVYQ